jgi:micrococcal nuclease
MVLLKVILGLVGLIVGFVAFVFLGWLILPAAGIVLAFSTGARDKLVRRLPAVGRLRPGALGLLVGLGGLLLSGGFIAVLLKTSPMQTATRPTATTLPPATPVAAVSPTHARATSTPTSVSPTAAAAPVTTEVPPTPIVEPTSAAADPQRPTQGLSSARVTRVIDGDTAEVLVGTQARTVRLIGIDAPEVAGPESPVECFGREALARARALLEGQTVSLESDPTQDELDQYRRTLSYVWLADGRLFNLEMIREGYANEYTFRVPYRYQETFKRAQLEAREHNRGLWAPDTCGGDTAKPADQPTPSTGPQPAPKLAAPTFTPFAAQKPMAGGRSLPLGASCPPTHPIKGNQGSRSTTDWIYHLPGGGSYTATLPEECFGTEADAQAAGYRRARN